MIYLKQRLDDGNVRIINLDSEPVAETSVITYCARCARELKLAWSDIPSLSNKHWYCSRCRPADDVTSYF